jgi:hypothetical protein
MKIYEVGVCIDYVLLTLVLAGGEWSASRPGGLNPGERDPSAHWIAVWMEARAGLDDVEK